MESINEWVADNTPVTDSCWGSGNGAGCGFGDGSGYGTGSGYGFGYGDGDDFGWSAGSGFGAGNGAGEGWGYDFGDGYGSIDGTGNGAGSGKGISEYNGRKVYEIDDVQTLISHTCGAIAKGYILKSDLTLTPCYIAKGSGYFAHGESVRAAVDALRAKILKTMDPEETITEFMKEFKEGEKYAGYEFYKWHHYLTGSCEMGRKAFVKDHEIDLDKKLTVEEFIELCENEYGCEIIRRLKEKWTAAALK